jgi:hypothetical protein
MEKMSLQLEMELREISDSVQFPCEGEGHEGDPPVAKWIATHKDAAPECTMLLCEACAKDAFKALGFLKVMKMSQENPDAHIHCHKCRERFEVEEAVIKEM